jgi:RNA polymerase sigma-70 factor (ECF subfamily)
VDEQDQHTPSGSSVDSTSAAAPHGQLMELLYHDLKAVAAHRLKGERPDHTLQPTALVHEAYLRLSERPDVEWESRTHFFRAAAIQIRRVLVDHARSRNRKKRGGGLLRVTLSDDMVVMAPEVDMLALDEALTRLDQRSTTDRQIVELKFFAGLTEDEVASALGISDRTVRRRWTFARAWLLNELVRAGGADDNR